MVQFNFPKVSKITKIDCPELSTVTSDFLEFHGFRKREREGERKKKREKVNSLQGSFSLLIFHIPSELHPELHPEILWASRLLHQNFALVRFVYSIYHLFCCKKK